MADRRQPYSRKYRITRENELREIQRTGIRLRTEHFDARAAVSLLSYCRVTVVVGKAGHTVVERNRLKRRIRELARMRLMPFQSGVDLVIRAAPSAYDQTFDGLAAEIDVIGLELLAIAPRD